MAADSQLSVNHPPLYRQYITAARVFAPIQHLKCCTRPLLRGNLFHLKRSANDDKTHHHTIFLFSLLIRINISTFPLWSILHSWNWTSYLFGIFKSYIISTSLQCTVAYFAHFWLIMNVKKLPIDLKWWDRSWLFKDHCVQMDLWPNDPLILSGWCEQRFTKRFNFNRKIIF